MAHKINLAQRKLRFVAYTMAVSRWMKWQHLRRTSRKLIALLLVSGALPAHALDPNALPQNGIDSYGTSTKTVEGANLTINQHTNKLITTWSSYNIGQNASVNYIMPDASSISLNYIQGGASQIYGSLNANGQVFLINPDGILFGRGAQVNVGGLVASSLNLNQEDFINGSYRFTQGNGAGSIINQGSINANGGYVAFLAPTITNNGSIIANSGSVAMLAGDQITLTLANNRLINYKIDQGTYNSLIQNKALIQADGGMVLIEAKAAGDLASSVVNNTGIIQARTMENQAGVIKLMGDMQTGTVNVGGTLDASAPTTLNSNGGNGGFIETSAAHVKVADNTHVTTLANNGNNGTWLIDPVDFTISATGDMSAAAVEAALSGGNLSIMSSAGAAGTNGDINVNDAITWNANNLTLTAANDININAVMTANGTSTLTMNTGTGNGADIGVAGGTVNVGLVGDVFTGRVDFGARSGGGILTINGITYTVINDLTTLRSMQDNTTGHYALGSDIHAAGANFLPVLVPAPGGSNPFPSAFTGGFDGLGHVISDLNITDHYGYSGLFGLIGNVQIRNVGMENVSMATTDYSSGALAGSANNSMIVNSWSSGTIGKGSATYFLGAQGGLIGSLTNSVLKNSHSSMNIDGTAVAGGLVGNSYNNLIIDSYATGNVNANQAGGLVGAMSYEHPRFINSHYNIDTVLINGAKQVTAGGIYATQYNDWLSHNLKLNIADYAVNLPLVAGTYQISTTDGLKDLLGFSNVGYSFKLVNNLDLGSLNATSQGGWFIPQFNGTLDGDNFTISGLMLDRSGMDAGLGLIGNARNTTLKNLTLAGASVYGGNGLGTLVGYGDNLTIDNVMVSGVVGKAGTYTRDTGGLAGILINSTVTNSGADVDVAGGVDGGGLIGRLVDGNISDSFANGAVIMDGGEGAVGGLVGYASGSGTISRSYAAGHVSTTNSSWGILSIGGLVGRTDNYTIQETYAIGNVNIADTVSNQSEAGGLVGVNGGNISLSYASGSVTGGNITSGGLVGTNNGSIDKSYANGAVSSTSGAIGGLIGAGAGIVTDSFWDVDRSGQPYVASNPGMVGKSTAEMQTLATFTNWDIDAAGGTGKVWRIYEGQTAPLLRYFLNPLTITANNTSKTYDGMAYSGGNGVNYSSAPLTDTLNGSATYSGASQGAVNAGSYAISVATSNYSSPQNSGFNRLKQNYDISYADGALTINPAPLTISANNAAKTYDGQPYTGGNGATYNGFVNGETPAVLGGALAYGGTAQGAINVGQYAITPNGLTSGNYNITFVDGALSIQGKPVTPPAVTQIMQLAVSAINMSTSGPASCDIGQFASGGNDESYQFTAIQNRVWFDVEGFHWSRPFHGNRMNILEAKQNDDENAHLNKQNPQRSGCYLLSAQSL